MRGSAPRCANNSLEGRRALEGINDIGIARQNPTPTAEDLIAGHKQLIFGGRIDPIHHQEFLGGDMRKLISAVAFATTLTGVGSASAQPYPSRPITMVTPFAAGGGTDTIARAMAERMKSSLGQPIIVEDVTGAGGTIAVGRVARAAPDGYTLSLGNTVSIAH
jgi:hypothetical protein